MNYNKLDLIPGDTVILDETFKNSSEVIIVRISPNGMFSRVYSAKLDNPTDNDCWDVMTYRLTKIK